MRAANLRCAAAVGAIAVAATLLLPVPAASQAGRSLPAPPGTADAAFRLSEPRVAPLPAAQWTAEQRAVAESYARTGAGGNALATMLRIPELAESVHRFLDYTSHASTLPARDREILILRVAWLAQNAYLWANHAPAAGAAGLASADVRRIAVGPEGGEWGGFDATLLRFADELFRNSSVTDATWDALAARYSLLNLADAVMTVAEFTTLSMLLNSLGVQPDAGATQLLPGDVPYRLTAADREPALTRPRIEPGEGPGLRVTRTIARHPEVAANWRGNTNYVNRLSPLTPHDRELLILRIGWNCQAEYEWAKHVGSVGRARDHGLEPRRIAEGPDAAGWEPHEVALIEAADELYRSAIVSEATWSTLSSRYDTHEMVSIVMTVATYRFVSMTLNAFGVQLRPDDEGFPAL